MSHHTRYTRWTAGSLLTVLALSLTTLSRAAGPAPYEFSIMGGAAIPTDIYASVINNAGFIQGSLLVPVSSWFSAGIESGYAFKAEHDLGSVPGDRVTDSEGLLHITPEVEIGPWFQKGWLTFKPYITFGGGYYRVSSTLNAQSDDGSVVDNDHAGFGGFNYGVGTLLKLGPNLAVGPDIRYHTIFISDAPDFRYLTASMRVALLF